MWDKFSEESSIDPYFYLIVSNKLATYLELCTVYNTEGVLDLIELVDLEDSLKKAAEQDAKQKEQLENIAQRGR